jgi:hypothetical protein
MVWCGVLNWFDNDSSIDKRRMSPDINPKESILSDLLCLNFVFST